MKEKKKYLDYAVIKSRVSVYDVLVDQYNADPSVEAEAVAFGQTFSGPCPICKTKLGRPFTIIVAEKTSSWSCLAKCDTGGTVIELVARMEDTDTYGAAKLLTEWFDIDVEKKAEDKEPTTQTSGATSGKGYLRELDKELRQLLSAGDNDATVRFVKEKVLESYRNGQKVEKISA